MRELARIRTGAQGRQPPPPFRHAAAGVVTAGLVTAGLVNAGLVTASFVSAVSFAATCLE